jgi:beta-glucosidase
MMGPYEEEARSLLAQLTLEEKAALCSGADFWHLPAIPRLGLPSILLTDGPHGVRKQEGRGDHVGLGKSEPSTCFPTASALASSWNPELIERVGEALGREARALGVSVLLGPGINIKRNPLGGRCFEYFSEDPHLTAEMAIAWVVGLQRYGVGASLKHYAVNNHEYGRMVVDAIVDERTLREIYLSAFEATVKRARPWTVMASYNKLNGTYVSECRTLLTTILREEWGFEGLVVSDWGAVHDRIEGLRAGMDLEMPSSGGLHTRRILQAVAEGTLALEDLDRAVVRVLSLILAARSAPVSVAGFCIDDHHALAREAAEEACVLLKNEGGLLPLEGCRSLAVLGALAVEPRYQGSGSSLIRPTRLDRPLDELIERAGGGCTVRFAEGYPISGEATPERIREAVALASECEAVVLIAGLTPEYESEGFDRRDLRLPACQLELIAALAPVYSKLVVVLQNGAPVELPFAGDVAALLEAYLGGQAGGSALARVLFGDVSPSGRLAETFPIALEDGPGQPWFPGSLRQSQYREGLWVGYRYFDTAGVPVAFPFGHGLSYTRFEYTDLCLSGPAGPAGPTGPTEATEARGHRLREGEVLTLELTLRNAGERAGAEVVQVYVGQQHASVPRARRELKRFAKVRLEPGESRRVRLTLDWRAFARWSMDDHRWVVEADDYEIAVGASAADIRLRERLFIDGGTPLGTRDPALSAYFEPRDRDFDDRSFAALLGHPIPDPLPRKPYQLNSTLLELQDSRLGRLLRRGILAGVRKTLGDGDGGGDGSEVQRRLAEAIVDQMPLRMVVSQSGGRISPRLMRSLIHLMNGDWGKLLRDAPVESR